MFCCGLSSGYLHPFESSEKLPNLRIEKFSRHLRITAQKVDAIVYNIFCCLQAYGDRIVENFEKFVCSMGYMPRRWRDGAYNGVTDQFRQLQAQVFRDRLNVECLREAGISLELHPSLFRLLTVFEERSGCCGEENVSEASLSAQKKPDQQQIQQEWLCDRAVHRLKERIDQEFEFHFHSIAAKNAEDFREQEISNRQLMREPSVETRAHNIFEYSLLLDRSRTYAFNFKTGIKDLLHQFNVIAPEIALKRYEPIVQQDLNAAEQCLANTQKLEDKQYDRSEVDDSLVQQIEERYQSLRQGFEEHLQTLRGLLHLDGDCEKKLQELRENTAHLNWLRKNFIAQRDFLSRFYDLVETNREIIITCKRIAALAAMQNTAGSSEGLAKAVLEANEILQQRDE